MTLYNPLSGPWQTLKSLIKRRLGDATYAVLGDATGRVEVPDKIGYVYVRFPSGTGYTSPTIARSGDASYPNYAGAGVYVAYRYNDELEIVGAHKASLDQAGIDTRVLNPLNQQSRFVYPWQLTYGLANAVSTALTASTRIMVKSFRHYTGNVFKTFDTPDLASKPDLASYIPGTDLKRLAALWIDTYTNGYEITVSTPRPLNEAFDETDIQALTAGRPPDAMPLKAFTLSNGQIKVMQGADETDLRQHMDTPHIWGFPTTLITRERVRPGYTLVTKPFTASGDGDLTIETGGNVLYVYKSNQSASAPTVTDDSSEGYDIGSLWYDTNTDTLYIATDVTDGAAVWEAITGGGGLSEFTVEGDSGTPFPINATDNTLSFQGVNGIETTTDDTTQTVLIDGANIDTSFTVQDSVPNTITIPKNGTLNVIGEDGIEALVTGLDTLSIVATDEIERVNGAQGVNDTSAIWGDTAALREARFKAADGKWYKIDTDASPTLLIGRERGVVFNLGSGGGAADTTGVIRIMGPVGGYSGLSDGAPVYAHTTAGALTQTLPTPMLDGATIIVAEMGYAASASVLMVKPKAVIYRSLVTLTDGAIQSITHHSDPTTARHTAARFMSYDSILGDEHIGSADIGYALKGPSGAGGTTSVDTTGATLTFIGNSGGTIRRLAQSFQVTAGIFSQFTVFFDATTGSPGSLGWSLQADDGTDKPTGVSVLSGTFTPTASSNNTISVTNGVFIPAATKMWLVLQLTTLSPASGNFYQVRINSSGGYASGSLKNDTQSGGTFPGTWAGAGGTIDLRSTFTTSAIIVNDLIAQGFSYPAGATLTSVTLSLRLVGTLSGDMTLSIYNDSGGSPGSLITNGASDPKTITGTPSSFTTTEFVFPFGARPVITGSTQYHMVLSTSAAQNNANYIEVSADNTSPSYVNGQVKLSQSSSWVIPSPAADATFAFYVQSTEFEEKATGGLWESTDGSGMVAERLGDSASVNRDTVTRFRNVSLALQVYTLDVIVP